MHEMHFTWMRSSSAISNLEPCNPSTTRSARGCHPCLRYDLLPMCPGWTKEVLARPEGFEPPTPRFVVWCSIQLSYGRVAQCAEKLIPASRKRPGMGPIAIGFNFHWQVSASARTLAAPSGPHQLACALTPARV